MMCSKVHFGKIAKVFDVFLVLGSLLGWYMARKNRRIIFHGNLRVILKRNRDPPLWSRFRTYMMVPAILWRKTRALGVKWTLFLKRIVSLQGSYKEMSET